MVLAYKDSTVCLQAMVDLNHAEFFKAKLLRHHIVHLLGYDCFGNEFGDPRLNFSFFESWTRVFADALAKFIGDTWVNVVKTGVVGRSLRVYGA